MQSSDDNRNINEDNDRANVINIDANDGRQPEISNMNENGVRRRPPRFGSISQDLDRIPCRDVSDKETQASIKKDEQENKCVDNHDVFADLIIQELRREIRDLKSTIDVNTAKAQMLQEPTDTRAKEAKMRIEEKYREREEKLKHKLESIQNTKREKKLDQSNRVDSTDFEMLKAEIELLKTQLKQGEETNKTLGKLSN